MSAIGRLVPRAARIAVFAAAMCLLGYSAWAGTVATSKAEYRVGETVVITGAGWQPGEQITLRLSEDPLYHSDRNLTATADASGSFTSSQFVAEIHDVAVEFGVTATGTITPDAAGTTFINAPPSANLDQFANGQGTEPTTPDAGTSPAAEWQNGNVNQSQAHYREEYSVGYRARLENLPLATPITLVLGFDIKHSDKYALDYLTHFQRLDPHFGYSHVGSETVDPLEGVVGVSGTTSTFPIPARPTNISIDPDGAGPLSAALQPVTSFNALPGGERLMTLFGGTITNVVYVQQGDINLGTNSAEDRIEVTFTVDSPTAVLAWGGHIGSRNDWGDLSPGGIIRSAGGVSGSPYHMRLIEWNLNNLGNQDRSLSAGAVITPPSCPIENLGPFCAGTVNVHSAPAGLASYSWSFTSNTSGAFFVGPTNAQTVSVNAGTGGQYTLRVEVTDGGGIPNACEIVVTVNPLPEVTLAAAGPFCVDAAAVQLNGLPAGGTYSGTGVSAGGLFDPAAAGVGTHTITYSYTDGNGCSNSATTDIVVNPLPVVTLAAAGPFCVDAAAVQLNGLPAGGTYSGTGVSPGGLFDPAAAGPGTHTITYSFTDGNGCSNSATTDIVVNPLPVVTCAPLGPLCINASPVDLSALCDPAGGTFSGPGVSGTTFDPAVAGVGTHTIFYTYTDLNGCTSGDQMDVEVRPLPDFVIQGPTEACTGVPVELCGPEGDFGYLWSGPGGFLSTSRCISVSAGGAYTLIVTDLVGKCPSLPQTHNLTIIDCDGACPRTPGFWSHECKESSTPGTSNDLCDSGLGKPRALVFIYTGLGCEATHHAMDAGKVTCSGNPLMASTVRIRVSDSADPNNAGAKVFFDGDVNLGEAFTADAQNGGLTRFTTNTYAQVLGSSGEVLQSISFHTSCSQPIQDGDQYGTLLLTGYVGEDEPAAVIDPAEYLPEYGEPLIALGGAKLTPAQLTAIAECVDDKVGIFDWASGTDLANFCSVVKPEKPMTPRKQAKRQFAALLANNCAGELGIVASNGDVIELGVNTLVKCKDLLGNETPITIGDLILLVDAQLIALEPQPLDDKVVKKAYENIIKCLTRINEGKGLEKTCDGPSGGDLCDQSGGRPRGITFTYTGLDCSASNHSQDPDKVICLGDPADATPVRILATNSADPNDGGADVYFDGLVALGGSFVEDAANAGESTVPTNTYFYVFDESGNLLQSIKVHTSCSQPINLGDQYGSLRLDGFVLNGAAKDWGAEAEPREGGLESRLELYRPSPNPFTETTRYAYRISGSMDERVDIGIFDVAGRKIATLVNDIQSPGTHEVAWDGRDETGSRVRNGVYFLRSSIGGSFHTARLVVLKQ